MAELTTLLRTSTVDDVVTVIERDGGVIIEDFLSADVMDELRHDLLPVLAARNLGVDDFSGFRTRRMGALFAHSFRLADIATHPLYLGAAQHFVDVPVVYWRGDRQRELRPGLRVGATTLIQIGPGETAQPLHRDDWAFMWRHPAYGREARLQVMLALSEFTAENGGTMVIPGSHRWDDDRVPHRSEAIPTVMREGSALLWLGSLYHGGGTNSTTDRYRTGLTITLDAANVRQEENQYLSVPVDIVKRYPEQVQRLLGWSAEGSAYMGWVEIDGRYADPIELLR